VRVERASPGDMHDNDEVETDRSAAE